MLRVTVFNEWLGQTSINARKKETWCSLVPLRITYEIVSETSRFVVLCFIYKMLALFYPYWYVLYVFNI